MTLASLISNTTSCQKRSALNNFISACSSVLKKFQSCLATPPGSSLERFTSIGTSKFFWKPFKSSLSLLSNPDIIAFLYPKAWVNISFLIRIVSVPHTCFMYALVLAGIKRYLSRTKGSSLLGPNSINLLGLRAYSAS